MKLSFNLTEIEAQRWMEDEERKTLSVLWVFQCGSVTFTQKGHINGGKLELSMNQAKQDKAGYSMEVGQAHRRSLKTTAKLWDYWEHWGKDLGPDQVHNNLSE